MTLRAILIVLLTLAPLSAQTKSLANLQWLVGRWHLEEGDSQSEEIWQPAQGDNMTGTFRQLWITGCVRARDFA